MKNLIFLILFFLFECTASAQIYPTNESGMYEDILTPEYYTSAAGSIFRNDLNKLIFFAREDSFQHPLQNTFNQIPQYTIPPNGSFAVGKGPGGIGAHHKATDMHVGYNDTTVAIFAAHNGYVSSYIGAAKYRDYLTITKEIKDSNHIVLGKMVTVYAHLDLSLDALDGLSLQGQYVNQGDTISNHLYSGTAGGAHLHFEIRYYRVTDGGSEEFYGFTGAGLITQSTGSWSYGFWNPNIGYGFANIENHLNTNPLSIVQEKDESKVFVYPNPASHSLFVKTDSKNHEVNNLSIFNLKGELIGEKEFKNEIVFPLKKVENGIYFIQVKNESRTITRKIIIKK
ncbi:MAG: T9SS type A sorting domain-containing protein [Aureispira sp.]|nr:T9SS type A sorting domain-containing protein [Aureispira sp.]